MALRGTLTHWKTRLLAHELSITAAHALGLLEALWHTTAEDAPSGNIGRLSNSAIAMQMFTDINPDRLIAAFIASRHLDEDEQHRLIVHDWDKHADYNTKRKVARRNESIHTKCGDVQPSVRRDASQPVTTSHDASRRPYPEPEPEPVPAPAPEPEPVPEPEPKHSAPRAPSKPKTEDPIQIEFQEQFWPSVWLKVDIPDAFKAFKNARKTTELGLILAGMARQMPELRDKVARGFKLRPATWLNNAGWLNEVTTAIAPQRTLTTAERRNEEQLANYRRRTMKDLEEMQENGKAH